MTARTVAFGLAMAIALTTAVMSTTSATAEASLKIDPATVDAAKGQTFAVEVVQDAPGATSGAQVSIDFDPAILQVLSVAPGSAYATAPVFVPDDMAANIRKANLTGHLAQVAAAFTPPDAVPQGPASFLVIRFRAAGCGQTALGLPTGGPFNAQMISGQTDAYGHPVPVVTTAGQVTTCVGAGAVTAADAPDPAPIGAAAASTPVGLMGAVGIAAIGLLGGLAWRSRRRPRPDDLAE